MYLYQDQVPVFSTYAIKKIAVFMSIMLAINDSLYGDSSYNARPNVKHIRFSIRILAYKMFT